jgi:hypothetical protein
LIALRTASIIVLADIVKTRRQLSALLYCEKTTAVAFFPRLRVCSRELPRDFFAAVLCLVATEPCCSLISSDRSNAGIAPIGYP